MELLDFSQGKISSVREESLMSGYWIKMLHSLGHRNIFTLLAVILKSFTLSYFSDYSITVMGESAGGGSIMHHLTAKGGNTTPVFNKAILQSATYVPR